jgi:DNA-binding transcriptional regulator YiaG
MTAEEVRQLRRRLGLSQPAFARLVGVHEVSVSRWENGAVRVPEPTARLIKLLARAQAKARV